MSTYFFSWMSTRFAYTDYALAMTLCQMKDQKVRQMSAGHRHDTIIDHHGDWNFKKVVNMGAFLSTQNIIYTLIFKS